MCKTFFIAFILILTFPGESRSSLISSNQTVNFTADTKETEAKATPKPRKENNQVNFKEESVFIPKLKNSILKSTLLKENFELSIDGLTNLDDQISANLKIIENKKVQKKDAKERNALDDDALYNLKIQFKEKEARKEILSKIKDNNDNFKNNLDFVNIQYSKIKDNLEKTQERLEAAILRNVEKENEVNHEITNLKSEITSLKEDNGKMDGRIFNEKDKFLSVLNEMKEKENENGDLINQIKKYKNEYENIFQNFKRKGTKMLLKKQMNIKQKQIFSTLKKESKLLTRNIQDLQTNLLFLAQMNEKLENDKLILDKDLKDVSTKIKNIDYELTKQHIEFETDKLKKENLIDELRNKEDKLQLLVDSEEERSKLMVQKEEQKLDNLKLLNEKINMNSKIV